MDEKRSKRISKGKNQRRKKPAYVPLPPERLSLRHVIAAAPSVEDTSLRVFSRTRTDPIFIPSPDSSAQNLFPDPPGQSKLSLSIRPVKFQDAIANVDASFDFGNTLTQMRIGNIEVPHFSSDYILGDDNFMDNDLRPDSQANENSFLMDSILKVNRSNRSMDSRRDYMDTSESHMRNRFIRLTSGRRSPAPIMILDGLGENSGPTSGYSEGQGLSGLPDSLNASRVLFQTLPGNSDFSYETLPFPDKVRTEGLFVKVKESVLGLPKRSSDNFEKDRS
jgi:hypothetical protein